MESITRKSAGLEEDSVDHRCEVMKETAVRLPMEGVGKGRGGGGGGVVRRSNSEYLTCLHCVMPDSWVDLCFVVSSSLYCIANL